MTPIYYSLAIPAIYLMLASEKKNHFQDQDLLGGRILLSHPQCRMAYPTQHLMRYRRENRRVFGRRSQPSEMQRHHIPWPRRRTHPRGM